MMDAFSRMFGAHEAKAPSTISQKREVEGRLVHDKPTAGYVANTPLRLLTGFGNNIPPISMFYMDVEMMLLHPCVINSLRYFKSGLASAEVAVSSKNKSAAKFAESLYFRLWSNSLSILQQGYDYGWGGFEIVYRFDQDHRLSFDTFKPFHPRDVRLLLQNEEYYGLRVTHIRRKNKPVDLWGPKEGLAKGFWYTHNSKYGSIYGWSQLFGAWRPWRRLAYQDGAEDVTDLAVYRHGIRGPQVGFPPGKKNVSSDKRDSRDPSNAEHAQWIGEQAKAGAAIAYPMLFDEQTGHPLWKFDWPTEVLNVDSLCNYADKLENHISLGIGVPPELIQAAEVGSGYSGRQIPLEAYYELQTGIARDIIEQFTKQVVNPLVKWNYGPDVDIEAVVVPLLDTRRRKGIVDNSVTRDSTGFQAEQQAKTAFKPLMPHDMLRLATNVPDGIPNGIDDPFVDVIVKKLVRFLKPIYDELVSDITYAMTNMPEWDRWDKVFHAISEARQVAIEAVGVANLASTLSAMKRVVESAPDRIPRGESVPPAPPPIELADDDGEDARIVKFPLIDEAAQDLMQRQVMTPQQYESLKWQAKEQAFTVASVTEGQALTQIRDSLSKAVDQGLSEETWQEHIKGTLGYDPFLSPAHQSNVFRTNVQAAYSKGMDRVLDHAMVGSYFPYEAIDPVGDDRTRPWHNILAVSGIQGTNIYRRDDPTYQIIKPPSDYSCRCGRTPLSVDMAAEKGITEAIEWLRTGIPPAHPAHVPLPHGWRQSPGFQRLATDIIPGGKADNRPDSDFDPEQLWEGIRVESEHTDSLDIAKEIAKDHLTEDKEYYIKLKKMEAK